MTNLIDHALENWAPIARLGIYAMITGVYFTATGGDLRLFVVKSDKGFFGVYWGNEHRQVIKSLDQNKCEAFKPYEHKGVKKVVTWTTKRKACAILRVILDNLDSRGTFIGSLDELGAKSPCQVQL